MSLAFVLGLLRRQVPVRQSSRCCYSSPSNLVVVSLNQSVDDDVNQSVVAVLSILK